MKLTRIALVLALVALLTAPLANAEARDGHLPSTTAVLGATGRDSRLPDSTDSGVNPTPVVTVVHAGGFDWAAAGIGAVAGIGAALALGGLLVVATDRRKKAYA